jgi:hypothetical protein
MKVTIISNGRHQLVLKPETPLEILAIKELEGKNLISKYHESTQILAESSPNCLVISPSGGDVKQEEPILNWLAVIYCNEKNRILGLIPAYTPRHEVSYFIKQQLDVDKVDIGDVMIPINQSFRTHVTSTVKGEKRTSEQEFALMEVSKYTEW